MVLEDASALKPKINLKTVLQKYRASFIDTNTIWELVLVQKRCKWNVVCQLMEKPGGEKNG